MQSLRTKAVVKKRQATPEIFGDYSNFIYLLTELELIVEAGTVDWSKTTAKATTLRLEGLAEKLRQVSALLETEQAGRT